MHPRTHFDSTNLSSILAVLAPFLLLLNIAQAQDRSGADKGANSSLIQRFDTNGDGKIDEQERRAVRSKMQQMQNKPGAMTPSAQPKSDSQQQRGDPRKQINPRQRDAVRKLRERTENGPVPPGLERRE
ncbi:MAG: hypothetical protein RJB11_2085, partial [Planctomycetota bacterium]